MSRHPVVGNADSLSATRKKCELQARGAEKELAMTFLHDGYSDRFRRNESSAVLIHFPYAAGKCARSMTLGNTDVLVPSAHAERLARTLFEIYRED